MRRFDDVIEVGHLPPPKLVEEVAASVLRDRQLAEYRRLWPDFADDTEYEPVRAQLGVSAYEEWLIRMRINEAALASHTALATGADLDIKGEARQVRRKLITPADPDANPPVDAVWETDDEYRRRIQLAPESWSVAGPEGAYVFWAMVPETSFDVAAFSPAPCEADIVVMGRDGNGTASVAALDLARAALDPDRVIPFTDRVTVRSVQPVTAAWTGTLYVKPGADGDVVLAAARTRAAAYAAHLRYVGRSAQPVGAYGALAVPGVERAVHNLSDGLIIGPDQVIHIETIDLALETVHD